MTTMLWLRSNWNRTERKNGLIHINDHNRGIKNEMKGTKRGKRFISMEKKKEKTKREDQLNFLSLNEAKEWLEEGKTSAEELVEASLSRLSMWQKRLNPFISIIQREELINKAKESDELRKKGKKRGKLEGIPLSIKDNFCSKGIKTSCGSKMLSNYIPPYDSTVKYKLEENGGIIIGKTNMDEFAMGSSSTNSYFGPVVNPWSFNLNPSQEAPQKGDVVAGGSSGGGACSVAGQFCFGSIGSDTGGSVRQPAAFCGIVGFKPTYGRISRHGLVAFGSSLDTPAIFAKNVGDSALLLESLSGFDENDSTSIKSKPIDYHSILKEDLSRGTDLRGVTIGIPKEYYVKELSDEIYSLWMKGAERLEKAGANVVEITLPNTKNALPSYYIIAPSEAYSNLARFDGIRFGYQLKGETSEDSYSNTRSEGFGDEVKRRILLGSFALSRK
eukprot:TRINITY_DN771_c1_g1_i4.p1 TRINITY_DN771_c1_g1~~TRINITY_DN771_c1_g1_i4.p1  ORF type:complete len:444 (+),score=165.06 TRINITY_DN771_c1_g1_i4:161-1492(+)